MLILQQVRIFSAWALALACIAPHAGATVVQFENQTAGAHLLVANTRTIDGMTFSFEGVAYYMQHYKRTDADAPYDPTGSVFAYKNNAINMVKADGGTFSLSSFDAGIYRNQTPGTVNVTGLLADGRSIASSFPISHNSFQRFSFDSVWNNLQQVSFRVANTEYIQYDNIVYQKGASVPEPSTAALVLLALGVLGFTRRREPRSSTA